jgi:hypothetical protein
MSSKVQKVMTQPINLIFRFLQNVRYACFVVACLLWLPCWTAMRALRFFAATEIAHPGVAVRANSNAP